MGEVTEKIYCCDRGNNDNAIVVSIYEQEEEEKQLAKQYGMPYGEEVNDAQE